MRVRYYPDDDGVALVAANKGGDGATVRDDFGVILEFAGEGSEDITRMDVLRVSRFLPLSAERGYDAETDTLTLGFKPNSDERYRVVDNGDFVSYRQWFDDGSEWDVVAVDLRQASVHLAKVIASQPPAPDLAKDRAAVEQGGKSKLRPLE